MSQAKFQNNAKRIVYKVCGDPCCVALQQPDRSDSDQVAESPAMDPPSEPHRSSFESFTHLGGQEHWCNLCQTGWPTCQPLVWGCPAKNSVVYPTWPCSLLRSIKVVWLVDTFCKVLIWVGELLEAVNLPMLHSEVLLPTSFYYSWRWVFGTNCSTRGCSSRIDCEWCVLHTNTRTFNVEGQARTHLLFCMQQINYVQSATASATFHRTAWANRKQSDFWGFGHPWFSKFATNSTSKFSSCMYTCLVANVVQQSQSAINSNDVPSCSIRNQIEASSPEGRDSWTVGSKAYSYRRWPQWATGTSAFAALLHSRNCSTSELQNYFTAANTHSSQLRKYVKTKVHLIWSSQMFTVSV